MKGIEQVKGMKIARPKTEKYHNYEEGDCGHPEDNHFKKRFWKRHDRKKFFRQIFNKLNKIDFLFNAF